MWTERAGNTCGKLLRVINVGNGEMEKETPYIFQIIFYFILFKESSF